MSLVRNNLRLFYLPRKIEIFPKTTERRPKKTVVVAKSRFFRTYISRLLS